MPGFTRESAQRIASVVRHVERTAGTFGTTRRGKFDAPPGASGPLLFSFRCTLSTREPVAPETEPARTVIVAAGQCRTIPVIEEAPGAWQLKDEIELDVTAAGKVYIVYDKDTTTFADAEFGAVPSYTEGERVIEIAEISDDAGVYSLVQLHCGDIELPELPDGENDGDILHWDGEKWLIHPAPTEQSVLTWNMTDGLKWEAVEEFACPEEEA
jgi:hypothetical protein